MRTKVWTENLKERDHLGKLFADGRILLRQILRVWAGFILLRIQSHDEHM
jgi:hypothetical protein